MWQCVRLKSFTHRFDVNGNHWQNTDLKSRIVFLFYFHLFVSRQPRSAKCRNFSVRNIWNDWIQRWKSYQMKKHSIKNAIKWRSDVIATTSIQSKQQSQLPLSRWNVNKKKKTEKKNKFIREFAVNDVFASSIV